MKSKRNATLFRVLVLAAAVLGASATPAHAQSANGKFTLTHETRWGGAVLSPGDYTFSLESPSYPAQLVVAKGGGGKMAIILPRAVSTERLVEGSRLVLSRGEGGESFVSALYLEDLGLSLHYSEPKQMPASETAKLGSMAQAGK
ncbi:MAG: hypothetical protein ACRD3H_19800 [Terriglobales bacterium]